MASTRLQTESYQYQKDNVWPRTGRHILANYDDENIVVYQAFCPEIANFASEHGHFGGPKYSFERMTWVKTNFLWMMYRSGWATKSRQEKILAIQITRKGFEEILSSAREAKAIKGKPNTDHHPGPDEVRLQWDPDHDPFGQKEVRRAIQLGLRGAIVKKFNEDWIQRIDDVTDFVKEQYELVKDNKLGDLMTPRERVYVPEDVALCRHIRLDGFDVKEENVAAEGGACCTELMSKTTITGKGDNGTAKGEILLCLGGAFNPVHTRHVEVMVEAKKWLEDNTGFKVVAGRLAVAPDGYVKGKCSKSNQKCMKAEHRIKMCELACEDQEWLGPYNKPVGSAWDCGQRMKRDGEMRQEVKVGVIVGADRARNKAGKAKWNKESEQITICIGREGETGEIKEAFMEDQKEGKVLNSNFYLIPKELDNVSSTDVRAKLAGLQMLEDPQRKKEWVQEKLVQVGWIRENESNYILKNELDLYLN